MNDSSCQKIQQINEICDKIHKVLDGMKNLDTLFVKKRGVKKYLIYNVIGDLSFGKKTRTEIESITY
jgi:hypothetical protein